jgi:hypothetical protein
MESQRVSEIAPLILLQSDVRVPSAEGGWTNQGGLKMADFRTDLQCGQCRGTFSVELTKMRLHFRHRCPRCGFEVTVTESQAVKAHRTLDQLEHEVLHLRQVESRMETPETRLGLRG